MRTATLRPLLHPPTDSDYEDCGALTIFGISETSLTSARFLLHLRTPSGVAKDYRWHVFEDLDAAHSEAVDALQIILATDRAKLPSSTAYEIESEDRRLRMTVAGTEAFHRGAATSSAAFLSRRQVLRN